MNNAVPFPLTQQFRWLRPSCLLILFILLEACGGAQTKARQGQVPTLANVYYTPQLLGTTAHIQLWVRRDAVPTAAAKVTPNCQRSSVPLELHERPDSVGIFMSGFPNELVEALNQLKRRPECHLLNLHSTTSKMGAKLAKLLQSGRFAVGVIASPKESKGSLLDAVNPLVVSRGSQRPAGSGPLKRTSPKLSIHHVARKSVLRIQFKIRASTPSELATLVLTEASLLAARARNSNMTIQSKSTASPHEFVLEVEAPILLSTIKESLRSMMQFLAVDQPWLIPANFWRGRALLETEFRRHRERPYHYGERLARSDLQFGHAGHDALLEHMRTVSFFDWKKSAQSHLAINSASINIGISKEDGHLPGLEQSFLEEVLTEELSNLGSDQVPSVAATRPDMLIVHHTPSMLQSLRLAIGIPPSLGRELTPYLKMSLAHCLQEASDVEIFIDFEPGTLNIESHFEPQSLPHISGALSDLLNGECSAVLLTSPSVSNNLPVNDHHLDSLILGDSFAPTSTGTAVPVGSNSLSARTWYRRLMGSSPPIQFFATGPLDAHAIAPTIAGFTHSDGSHSWRNLTPRNSAAVKTLLSGKLIRRDHITFLPLKDLSPRKRIIHDALCRHLELLEAPISCVVERTPYLIGFDVLILKKNQTAVDGGALSQLKVFIMNHNSSHVEAKTRAFRDTVLAHEWNSNDIHTSAKWIQQYLWEPGRDWAAKQLWSGIFPEEDAIEELNLTLKALLERVDD